MRRFLPLLIATTLLGEPASARPLPPGAGFIILAEQRFEPAVQQLLAQRSLAALPLSNGRLFLIVPAAANTRDQQAQIRYLEYLLEKRGVAAEPESKAGE